MLLWCKPAVHFFVPKLDVHLNKITTNLTLHILYYLSIRHFSKQNNARGETQRASLTLSAVVV